MTSHSQLYVAMSRARRMEDPYFFGAASPLEINRKFGVDADAFEVVRNKKKRRLELLTILIMSVV